MDYSLPNSVVALLNEENASVTPKAYFISSGKKSIKITLVYAKDQSAHLAMPSTSDDHNTTAATTSTHRKKSRHCPTSKSGKIAASCSTPNRRQQQQQPQPQGVQIQQQQHIQQQQQQQQQLQQQHHHHQHHHLSNHASMSPPNLHPQGDPRPRTSSSSSSVLSEVEQGSSTPEFNMNACSDRRDRMSTVDSGHPPSSHRSTSSVGGTHHDDNVSVSGSEVNDEISDQDGESHCSSDSEKPRTPGREIAAPESSFGPGETPAASREEMWQTWTRIPRQQISHANAPPPPNFLASQVQQQQQQQSNVQQRSVSPCVRPRPRGPSGAKGDRMMPVPTQRRSRALQEPPLWDGQGTM